MTVTYAPEADPLDGSEFTFVVDENAVFSEKIESEALTICSLDLTTEKSGADENAWISDAWDCFDEYGGVWQAKMIGSYSEYMDWLGYDDFPAMDYDGDGVTDRIYRHYVNFGESDLWLFFGDGEAILLSDILVTGSNSGRLETLDITGDGRAEIIYNSGAD